MKRSEFLQSLAVMCGAACQPAAAPPVPPAPPAPPAPAPPAPPAKVVRRYKHWAWLTANHQVKDDEYKREFQRMLDAGVSVVLAEAFNGTEAFYASSLLPTNGDWLGRVLPLAQAVGLELYAWISCLPCNVEAVVGSHPEWFVVNKDGKSAADTLALGEQNRYLCPTRAPVREFLKQRVLELAKYPLVGIHLDYLQFPQVILPLGVQARYGLNQETETSAYDHCYCEVCRAKFKAQTEIDPLNFNQPAASDVWRQFRYDRLTDLVNLDLVPLIRQAKQQVSVAVLPDWEAGRQQYDQWQIDAALPLLYHTLYNEDLTWVGFQTQQVVERLAGKASCYSSLLVSNLSPPDLTGAVRLAIESGASGVGLYSSQAMSSLHWDAFQRAAAQAEVEAQAATEAEPAQGG